MTDPRWHFRKKNNVPSSMVDKIIGFYHIEAQKTKWGLYRKTYNYFRNTYDLEFSYEALRYLIKRYYAYVDWRRKARPESKDWGAYLSHLI